MDRAVKPGPRRGPHAPRARPRGARPPPAQAPSTTSPRLDGARTSRRPWTRTCARSPPPRSCAGGGGARGRPGLALVRPTITIDAARLGPVLVPAAASALVVVTDAVHAEVVALFLQGHPRVVARARRRVAVGAARRRRGARRPARRLPRHRARARESLPTSRWIPPRSGRPRPARRDRARQPVDRRGFASLREVFPLEPHARPVPRALVFEGFARALLDPRRHPSARSRVPRGRRRSGSSRGRVFEMPPGRPRRARRRVRRARRRRSMARCRAGRSSWSQLCPLPTPPPPANPPPRRAHRHAAPCSTSGGAR